MADPAIDPKAQPFSIGDLVKLLAALQKVQDPPAKADSGRDYYCQKNAQGIYQARELAWGSPPREKDVGQFPSGGEVVSAALDSVPYKSWLLGELIGRILTGGEASVALPSPPRQSKDLLGREVYPGMPNETVYTKALCTPKDTNVRYRFGTNLVIGCSEFAYDKGAGRMFSLGIRRKTATVTTGEDPGEALTAHLEMAFPILAFSDELDLIGAEHVPEAYRRLQFGLAFTRGDRALGSGNEVAASGLRFTVEMSVTPGAAGEGKRDLDFSAPKIRIQRREGKQGAWQDYAGDSWRKPVETLLKQTDIKDLLEGPVAPVCDRPLGLAGLTDLIKGDTKPIKESFTRTLAELKASKEFLKKQWKIGDTPDDADGSKPPKQEELRALGVFLKDLGFLSRKGSDQANRVYALEKMTELTFGKVFRELTKELDGFPLYVKTPSAGEPEDEYPIQIAAQLAATDAVGKDTRQFFGLRALAQNIPLKKKQGLKDKPDVEVLLQLGKWLSDESLASNWVRRFLPKEGLTPRTGMPGIAVYPVSFDPGPPEAGGKSPVIAQEWRIELTSLGVDIQGANDQGLVQLPCFGLGGVQVRLFFQMDFGRGDRAPRFSAGAIVKLKDLFLSFAPKKKEAPKETPPIEGVDTFFEPDDEEGQDDSGSEEIWIHDDDATDEDAEGEPPDDGENEEPEKPGKKKKKDVFSFSVGAMGGTDDPYSHWDIQLYNKKGKPGKVVWIPIERSKGPLHLKKIGITLEGTHALGKGKDLEKDKAAITFALTGGLKFGCFELTLLGAGLRFPFAQMWKPEFVLKGLEVEVKTDAVTVSGGFLKSGENYAGFLKIETKAFSIGAMGAYGMITDPKDKTKSFASFFIYATLGAGDGKGIGNSVFRITGLALGAGVNRRVKMPPVERVADFSLVKLVMGTAKLPGAKEEDKENARPVVPGDPRTEVSEPVKKTAAVLKLMDAELIVEQGQYFGCVGLRFTLFETVDCFALLIVQFGNDLEINLLGLARLKLPRTKEGEDATAMCYAELQLAATLKPADGILKLEARLSHNSWVFDKRCTLTGGFALCIWFKGEHEGDFVVSLGGYHPRFKRPSHYPMVPRVGLYWAATENLTFKGEVYAALTPACFMLGGSLQAAYRSERVNAWFTLYVDALIQWKPLYLELTFGISLRVEVIFLTTWNVEVSLEIQIWGPPFGGFCKVELTVVSFEIPFGQKPDSASKTLANWAQFGRNFLDQIEGIGAGGKLELADPANTARSGKWDLPEARRQIPGPSVLSPRLVAGQLTPTKDGSGQANAAKSWTVRADQLEIGARTSIPVAKMQRGIAEKASAVSAEPCNTDLTVLEGLTLKNTQVTEGAEVRVKPMDRDLSSELNVALVREDGSVGVDLSDWTMEPAKESLAAALWSPEGGPPVPEKPLVAGCVTGMKRLKPPPGRVSGEPRSVALNRFERAVLPDRTVADTPAPPPAAVPRPSKLKARNRSWSSGMLLSR